VVFRSNCAAVPAAVLQIPLHEAGTQWTNLQQNGAGGVFAENHPVLAEYDPQYQFFKQYQFFTLAYAFEITASIRHKLLRTGNYAYVFYVEKLGGKLRK